jgi:hypothetical protein
VVIDRDAVRGYMHTPMSVLVTLVHRAKPTVRARVDDPKADPLGCWHLDDSGVGVVAAGLVAEVRVGAVRLTLTSQQLGLLDATYNAVDEDGVALRWCQRLVTVSAF